MSGRPYRSHKYGACTSCRRKRRRCDVETDGAPCKRCSRLRQTCSAARPAHDVFRAQGSSSAGASTALGRSDEHDASALSPVSPAAGSTTRRQSAVLITGPEISDDVHALKTYFDASGQSTHENPTPYHTVHASPKEAIVYVSVPRRRAGLTIAMDPGKEQLETVRQLLGSSHHELIKLYRERIHPYFPIIDLEPFHTLDHINDDKFPSTLLCYIYLSSIHLSNIPAALSDRAKSHMAHIDNLAITALQNDFMAPSMSTIPAAVLDLLGRPVKSVTMNILTTGKLVSLTYSHGLHRDPTKWSHPPEPTSVRKRLWWAVFVVDQWGSYAHGTPPNIITNRYDVPMVENTDLASAQADAEVVHQSESFKQLCVLSRILSELLSLIHDLATDWGSAPRTLRRVDCALDDWETDFCRLYNADPEKQPPSGHCSLWLSFISVKLLVQRLYLRAASFQANVPATTEKQYRATLLRARALSIVDFVISMSGSNFQEFWFSFTAHFLVSTAITLLRSTIELDGGEYSKHCKSRLMAFKTKLESAKAGSNWDIAELCLERCSRAIERVTSSQQPVGSHAPFAAPGPAYALAGVEEPRYESHEQELFDPAWLNDSDTTGLCLPPDSLGFLWDGL